MPVRVLFFFMGEGAPKRRNSFMDEPKAIVFQRILRHAQLSLNQLGCDLRRLREMLKPDTYRELLTGLAVAYGISIEALEALESRARKAA